MRVDTVLAIIGDADGYVDEFFGEQIERAGFHGGFQIFPGAFQQSRIMRNRFPEIVDVVRLARRLDVLVYRPDLRTGVLIFNKSESGHVG